MESQQQVFVCYQIPSKTQTDKQTNGRVCLFVCVLDEVWHIFHNQYFTYIVYFVAIGEKVIAY